MIFFTSFESILSFQHLTLKRTSICDAMGEALAQFCRRHCQLQTLSLLNCTFESRGAMHILGALSQNSTLEHFSLLNCDLGAGTFSTLCSVLTANSTLRSLLLPEVDSTSPIIQEGNPVLELLKLESPGRVQFPLLVRRPMFVPPALAQALGCAAKVMVFHGDSSNDTLCSVYNSLELNHYLHSLHIEYEDRGSVYGGKTSKDVIGALCTALRACVCLQTFHLDVHNCSEETAPLLADVFDALAQNPCIRKLSLVTSRLTPKTAEELSALVAQRKMSLVQLQIVCIDSMSDAVLGVLHKMVIENVFLSMIDIKCSDCKDVVRVGEFLDDVKAHNLNLLNKATRFVMSLDKGPATSAEHHCAAAFDELCGTASLRDHLQMLSGKSEFQVSMDVKRAKCYLEDNYMMFAGVVQAEVVCEVGDGSTQLDDLNVDCFRAIAQYLKLSDVIR
uniref:Ran gtpase-activating protein n=1 Tax=Amblyomma triste TaxID=251400 RepID=A0A023GC29_AMBTT